MSPDCGIVGEGVVGIMVVGMPCEEPVTATPGFIRNVYEYYKRRREDEEERPEVVAREAPSERAVREYAERSGIIEEAIAKVRAESAALKAELDELRSRIERASSRKAIARLDHELMLQEQRATLAAAEEAALAQEQELNEVASIALMYELIQAVLAAQSSTVH